MAKVSVVIPVYNVEQYLKQCLDSVINQTLKDIEIICINDCSPDNSSFILDEYAKKDERIKVISLAENKGTGNARNQGINRATGEYLMFLDSDDWFELNACEVAYNEIKKSGNNIAYFNYIRHDIRQGTVETIVPFKDYFKQDDVIYNVKLYENKDKFYLCSYHCTGIYDREFIISNNIKYPDGIAWEDSTFKIQALVNADEITLINSALLNYRFIWKSNRTITKWVEEFEHIELAYKYVKESKYSDYYVVSFLDYLPRFIVLIEMFEDKKQIPVVYDRFRKFCQTIYNQNDKLILKKYAKYSIIKNVLAGKTYQEFYIRQNFWQIIFSSKNVYIKDKKCKQIMILGFKIII